MLFSGWWRCAGTREFDYNLDGLAHYGLIPDMLQDAANRLKARLEPDGLAALFQSAEGYIQVWESIWRTRPR